MEIELDLEENGRLDWFQDRSLALEAFKKILHHNLFPWEQLAVTFVEYGLASDPLLVERATEAARKKIENFFEHDPIGKIAQPKNALRAFI
jgi:hypothetical protein